MALKDKCIEIAYGLLWAITTDDKRIHKARRLLLEALDKQRQARGIEAAKGIMLEIGYQEYLRETGGEEPDESDIER